MQPADADRQRLLAVKLAHTAIWAVFAGAVVGIPVATFVGDIRLGLWQLSADRGRRPLHAEPRGELRHLPAGMARREKQADLRLAVRGGRGLLAAALARQRL